MKKQIKIKYIYIFLFAIILLIGLYLFNYYIEYNKEPFESNDVIMVVSRYNEDLEWFKDETFQKYPVLIYNKGNNTDFYKPEKLKEIISLQNVGREGHTYLYYIIQNYDNLPSLVIFLPGSTDINFKLEKSKRMMNEIEKNKSAVIIANNHENVKNELYDFKIDYWKSTNENNSTLTKKHDLKPSEFRPFGKWFEHHFGDLKIQHVFYGGIFSVSKEDILQHPKSYYENLIKELNNDPNPEVGHYFERSWEAVFYPMKHCIFME